MSDDIPEDKTTAFPCPTCETKDPERRWARKEFNKDGFVCRTCRRKYKNRHEANRIRKVLATLSK
jgi:ssDNA-binding Zn-finger/Zn-ribbon topoisomerase 1